MFVETLLYVWYVQLRISTDLRHLTRRIQCREVGERGDREVVKEGIEIGSEHEERNPAEQKGKKNCKN